MQPASIRPQATERRAEPAAGRGGHAEDEAGARRLDAVHADEERRQPEPDAVSDEGEQGESERGQAQRPRTGDQRVGRPIAQRQRLQPRDAGVEADAERDPLRRAAERRDQHRRDRSDCRRGCEIAGDAAPPRAGECEVHDRQRRQHGAQLAQERAQRTWRTRRAGSQTVLALPRRLAERRAPRGRAGVREARR